MPFLNDHPYIYFEVETAGLAPLRKNDGDKKGPSFDCINRQKYFLSLSQSLSKWESHHVSVSSSESIELLIGRISLFALALIRPRRKSLNQ